MWGGGGALPPFPPPPKKKNFVWRELQPPCPPAPLPMKDYHVQKLEVSTYMYCVVPENIHTPTTEGISHRTPPPRRIFHFRGIFLTPPPPPTPSEIPQIQNTPPPPSGKVLFSKKRLKNQFDVNILEISRTAYTRRKDALSKSARVVQFHR